MKPELHILILEDVATDAELMMHELRREDILFSAKRVWTEADFLAELRTAPDVILADYSLPSWDGLSALEAARRELPDVPFIFVSGSLGEETAVDALHHGARDYVLKQRLPRLGPAVRHALRESELARERKRSEARIQHLNDVLKAIQDVNSLIVRERNRDLILEEACKILVQTRGYRLVWIGGVVPDSKRVVPLAVGGPGADYADAVAVTWDDSETGRGPVGTALRTRGVFVCQNTATDPDFAPWRALALARGYRSVAAVPLIHGDRLFGAVNFYADRPEAFDDEELQLLKQLADNLAFALRSAEAEQGRKRVEAALRDAESLYRSLVEHLPQCIFRKDPEGRFTFVNGHFCALLGKTEAEILGKTDFDLFPRDLAERYRQDDLGIFESGKNFEAVEENELPDRPRTMVQVLKTPVRDAAGGVVGVQGILTDITKQKNLEAQFLRVQRLESIGSLASGIAHDLNNILTPIMMCAPLLRASLPEGERDRLLTTVETSAERAAGIVRQLLTFGRGKEDERVLLQVRHLVRDMGKIVRETFPRSIEVKVDCPNLWPVRGNATQIHQILLNLCINARDAMPNGGRLILRAYNVVLDEHYVSMYPEAKLGPFVRILVTDTGTGIPDSVRDRIFDPFFSTKGMDAGTGLGLTTVLGIVKEHNGFITFVSHPGKGTTFEIHLPATPDAEALVETEQARALAPPGQGELVLVVDDEPAIRGAAERTLKRHHYEVILANDGIDAVAQFTSHRDTVRAVVTDLSMPLMDGTTLCRTLRRLNPTLPIIVSTGAAVGPGPGELLSRLADLGITTVLQKPHSGEELLKALFHVLHEVGSPAS